MPPRAGPRSKRRPKIGPPRHFTIWRTDGSSDLVIAHSVELDDGSLVLRDQAGAICRIITRGGWREIRPAVMTDMRPDYLTPPVELPAEPNPAAYSGTDNRPAEETDEVAREQAIASLERAIPRTEEPDRRFVPSSPEEAQRILMEIERRLAPEYHDPEPDLRPDPPTGSADAPPPPRPKE